MKLFFLVFLSFSFAIAQVGINTETPNALLDIQSTNQVAPANTDGLLIPKIDEFPTTNPTALQDGMMVYATGNGSVSKGFYSWNEATTNWLTFNGVNQIDQLADGKSDSDGTQDGSSMFLGVNAGENDDSTDNANVGIGYLAMRSMESGRENTAIGAQALSQNVTQNFNTAVGSTSLWLNTNGLENTGVGGRTLFRNIDGNYNTAIGGLALYFNTSGHRNTALGSRALYNTMGDANVAIGYNAGLNEVGSNKLYIENSDADADNALIYGEFDTNLLRTNGTFQIGNPATTGYAFPLIDGSANQIMQTDGNGIVSWANVSATGAERINELLDGKSDNDGTDNGSSLFIGINAGSNDDETNNLNVGIGFQALQNNSTGTRNSALGNSALSANTSGVNNTALGTATLTDNTIASNNTAIGASVLHNNTSGDSNTSIGTFSMFNNTDGFFNVATGYSALYRNSIGQGNLANGAFALFQNSTGNNNVALGAGAGYWVNGDQNVFIGREAGHGTSGHTKNGSVYIGYQAGNFETNSNRLYIENSNGNANSALIYGEFDTNTLRTNGTLQIGNPASTGFSFPVLDGTANQIMQTNGNGNLSWTNIPATGAERINDLIDGKSDDDGTENGSSLFLGINAGLNDTGTNNRNVGIGFGVLQSNTTGVGNSGIGYNALLNTTTGYGNTAIGRFAMWSNIDGLYNVGIGTQSLGANTSGIRNSAIGNESLQTLSNGNRNAAIGSRSGLNISSGDDNVFLGAGAGHANTTRALNGSIFIGASSGSFETNDNRLYIENSDSTTPLIYGAFDNDILGLNANVAIGHQAPLAPLHIENEGTSGIQNIVAALGSNTSNRPVLLFSESSFTDLSAGMSLEYNGTGSGAANRMVINNIGGSPLFEFRNGGSFTLTGGSMYVNHPSGSATEGLILRNTVDTDTWRLYTQWNSNSLALMFNNVNVGNFDDVSGVYTAVSDRNLKKNIVPTSSVMEKVKELKVVDYNFKGQQDTQKYTGLIAQEVAALFPNLVVAPNEESENYTMDYSGFGVLAIKAIQEQQSEIAALKKIILSQQQEISEIKALLKASK